MFEANVLTVTQAAQEKGCTRQAIYNAIEREDLNTLQLGSLITVVRDNLYQSFEIKPTGGRTHKAYLARNNS